jgi:hypothetical protein
MGGWAARVVVIMRGNIRPWKIPAVLGGVRCRNNRRSVAGLSVGTKSRAGRESSGFLIVEVLRYRNNKCH